MRNILIMILSIGLVACEDDGVHNPDDNSCANNSFSLPDIPCFDVIEVNIAQSIKLVNTAGEWSELIDWDYLSLMAVEPNGEQIYSPTGVPLRDVVNLAEIIKEYDNQQQLTGLFCKFGYVYEELPECNYAVSYFKLQINRDRVDNIKFYYDIRCSNLFLHKFTYNGTEYIANDWETIDIIID